MTTSTGIHEPEPPSERPALVIDGRPGAADGPAPGSRLLGLSLPARAVLAARRAGYGQVQVVSAPDAVAAPARAREKAVWHEEPPAGVTAGPTVWIMPGVLAEAGWLGAAAAEAPAPGNLAVLGPGVAMAGEGVPFPDLAAAASDGRDGPLDILRLTSPKDRAAAERRLMAALVKDTDGFMARYFARPISLWLSRRLARTPVTPNQMTVVSLLIGLAAAPFFLFTTPWLQAIGGLLFVAHSVIDGCDGELARLKFTESRIGGLLDFWSDNVVHVAVFGCMGAGWVMAADALWPLWFMAGALVGTAGSALAVYWLTLRPKPAADTGPVYTSVAAGPPDRLSRMLDDLSRRDFIYLVFALSLFGKAAWFLAAAGVGAPVFLAFVLWLAWRNRRAK